MADEGHKMEGEGEPDLIIPLYTMQGDKKRLWTISVRGATVTTRFGFEDSKKPLQERSYTVTKGKQKRTVEEQARFEATSKAQATMRKGYVAADGSVAPPPKKGTVSDAISPMLLDTWNNQGHRWKATKRFAQPKLDGVRCTVSYRATDDGFEAPVLVSRRAKAFGNELPHLYAAFAGLPPLPEDYIAYDGELFAEGMCFETVTHFVRGSKNDASHIGFYAYDLIPSPDARESKPFETRLADLTTLLDGAPSCIVLTPTTEIEAGTERAVHDRYVDAGYEGAVLRRADGFYKFGPSRSNNTLKLKVFDQTEHIIVGGKPEKGKEDQLGAFELRTVECTTENGAMIETGHTFFARAAGTDAKRKKYLKNLAAHVDDIATVKHFGATAPGEGPRIPRFPVVLGIRHPDDMGELGEKGEAATAPEAEAEAAGGGGGRNQKRPRGAL